MECFFERSYLSRGTCTNARDYLIRFYPNLRIKLAHDLLHVCDCTLMVLCKWMGLMYPRNRLVPSRIGRLDNFIHSNNVVYGFQCNSPRGPCT